MWDYNILQYVVAIKAIINQFWHIFLPKARFLFGETFSSIFKYHLTWVGEALKCFLNFSNFLLYHTWHSIVACGWTYHFHCCRRCHFWCCYYCTSRSKSWSFGWKTVNFLQNSMEKFSFIIYSKNWFKNLLWKKNTTHTWSRCCNFWWRWRRNS